MFTVKAAVDLKTGDRLLTHNTVVTVLADAWRSIETIPPLTGQPCVRIRGRREDSGAEGTMTFGITAGVQIERTEGSTDATRVETAPPAA